MSDVITQFLVGIGVKYDDNGQKKFEDGMSSMQSVTLRAGGVIATALAAAGVVVDQNARHIARVNLEATRMTASTQYVLSYGAALERMGGSADDAVSNLQKMDQIMDDLHVRGQSGTLNELAQAGFNVSYLTQARNAPDLQERIANEYQHANPAQRRVASSVLGIDSATANLYAGGGDYLKQQVEQAGSLENVTQNLIDKSAAYNLQLRDAQTAWNGLVNTATDHYLPAMTQVSKVSQSAFEWLDKFIQNHPKATDTITAGAAPALVGGAIGAGASVAARVGIPGAAGVARFAGPIGVAAGVSAASEPYIDKGLNHLFGRSEYFQNVRTAQTWGDFGRALVAPFHHHTDTTRQPSIYDGVSLQGMRNVVTGDTVTNNAGDQYTTHNAGDQYTTHNAGDHDQSVRSVTHHYYGAADVQRPVAESDYERQAKATAQALHTTPVRVDNHVDARLYIDGREIDHRIEQYENQQNQHSININSPQVDR